MSSGITGSSNHRMLYCSSSFAILFATGTEYAWFASTIKLISSFGPIASLMALIRLSKNQDMMAQAK